MALQNVGTALGRIGRQCFSTIRDDQRPEALQMYESMHADEIEYGEEV